MWGEALTALVVASAGRAGRSRERERETRDEGGEASRRSQATMGVIKGKPDRHRHRARGIRLRGDTRLPGTMVDLNSFLF